MVNIGDHYVGFTSNRYDRLQSYVMQLRLYPFKLSLEIMEEEKVSQIKFSIFKYNIGIFIGY